MTSNVPLCIADDATFWPWRKWTDFAGRKDRDQVVVVVPLAGMTDWGLGHPLDSEETVLMSVLKEAAQQFEPKDKLLVIPPLRFQFGADPHCAFALLQDVAHAQLAEICGCIANAGFKKIVFYNASPWSEELLSAAGRDLRISLSVQMFAIHLSALGLDFHPVRNHDRRKLQSIVTALTGVVAEDPGVDNLPPRTWGDESIHPLQGPASTLEESKAIAAPVLTTAALTLASLLCDIEKRPLQLADLRWA